jgi:hypothetical protein
MTYGPDEFQRDLGVTVPRETIARLETHHRLLAEWSEHMNLVGPKELDLSGPATRWTAPSSLNSPHRRKSGWT